MAESGPGLGRSVARGATVMLGVAAIAKLSASLSQFVLAAVLTQSHFGLVSLTLAVVDVTGLIQKLGLRELLTHHQKDADRWIGPALWVGGIGGLASAGVIAAVAPFASAFYEAPELLNLLLVAALANAMHGMIVSLEAYLGLQFRFRSVGQIQVVELLLRAGLAIAFAFMGMGAMSMILPLPIVAALRLALLLRSAGASPGSLPGLAAIAHFWADTRRLFGVLCMQVVMRRGDALLLGAFAPTDVVGVYYFAYNLSTQVIMLIAQSLNPVLAAGLSKLQQDTERQRAAFIEAVGTLAFVAIPVVALQAAVAGPLLRTLYLDRWEESVWPLRILSVSAAISIVGWNSNSMFIARGRFRAQFYVTLMGLVVCLIAMISSASTGSAVILALGMLGYRLIYIPMALAGAIGSGLGPLLSILRVTAGPVLLSAAVLTPIAITVETTFPGDDRLDHALQLVTIGFAGGIGLYATHRLFLPRAYRSLAQRVRSTLPDRIEQKIPSLLL